mmetsp:Transcript_2527/g.3411  ORF Transcript_2527/g.3411 Transcript_2527/m.3411 type:complete len:129 (+) Transcript_2527:113-499(+)
MASLISNLPNVYLVKCEGGKNLSLVKSHDFDSCIPKTEKEQSSLVNEFKKRQLTCFVSKQNHLLVEVNDSKQYRTFEEILEIINKSSSILYSYDPVLENTVENFTTFTFSVFIKGRKAEMRFLISLFK